MPDKIMTLDEIISRFPSFVSVVGEKWGRQNKWCQDYISSGLDHFKRLESDLKKIEGLVEQQSLRKTFVKHLRDQKSFTTTLYEIHGISLVSQIASSLELKVPLGGSSGNNFDARACVLGISVNIECKSRDDKFPFNFAPVPTGPENIPVYSGSRATLDPHDAEQLGLAPEPERRNGSHIPIPESTEVRRILLKGLSQLPETGINLIVFGHLRGSRDDLERALYGPPVVDFATSLEISAVKSSVVQLPHGAYDAGANGEPFRGLSGVLWFKLLSGPGPEYKLYPNPNATSPLPQNVITGLESVIG
jgi:hypothetical protein